MENQPLSSDSTLKELDQILGKGWRESASFPPLGEKPPRIAVGMSGGVDSSVAALLLQALGYDVFGIFMKNWDEEDENGNCTAADDFNDVQRVCEKIGIPYYSVSFSQEYWKNVFEEFLEDYSAGLTPNPDILCNREIKFNVFLKKALAVGADYLATGHYCQREKRGDLWSLTKGDDPKKEQSYFLYTLTSDILSQVLFPIGHIEKSKVRHVANRFGLVTHDKKDSTGICFIGERNFRTFLSGYLQAKPGEFQLLDGTPVGKHQGCAYYTYGQRKGLGLGGPGPRWFVVGKDPEKNIVFVERGDRHPALYADDLVADSLTWVGEPPDPSRPFSCSAKIRYRQKDQPCTLHFLEDGKRVRVEFDQPQRAIAPKQSVVFYSGHHCMGGGFIESSGPTYFERDEPLPQE